MHVFLIGYYGFNNTGDDICLKKSKEIISSVINGCSFLVLARKQDCKAGHVNRLNIIEIIKAIKKSDKVIFGGGGLLQSATSTASLYYYLMFIVLAKLFKTPVLFLGQDIGPIKNKLNQYITRLILNGVVKGSLRSLVAQDYFRSNEKIRLLADISFYNANISSDTSKNSNIIGLNFREHKLQSLYPKIIALCEYKQLNPQGISLCPDIDTNVLQNTGLATGHIEAINEYNFYEKSKKNYKFIISMRYHCCVWAILQGIPFIALECDPKLTYLAKQMEQPYVKLNSQANKKLVEKEMEKIIQNMQEKHHEYTDKIEQNRQTLLNRAQEHKWVLQ
tara:strand:+ start:1431 stop:2432 length:1002 start_codon:yes stop_codon:yes gene_type:complete